MTIRPLDGFRVIDLAQNIAGPLAAQVLVDLGADVVKLEPPRGEAARHIISMTARGDSLASYWISNNRGKRSVVADLRSPAGAARFLTLVESADVVIDGFRPGTMDRWGLSREAVRARNPQCIYATVTGFGGSGSRGGRPAIDLVVQAESGMLGALRAPDGTPLRIPFQLVDGATGHVLAQAVLAALLHRERHGVVEDVSVAMFDVAVGLQSNRITEALNQPADGTAATSIATAPSGVFRVGDGHVVLAAYIPKHWSALLEVIERPDLAREPHFVDQQARGRHAAELTAELEGTFAAWSPAGLVDRLQAVGLMATEVATWSEVVAAPLFTENALAVAVTDGSRTQTTVRTPARYTGFSPAGTSPAPTLGDFDAD